jgi:hypothetical protein
MNAVAGRQKSMKNLEPTKFSDMRKGCWDINERVRDMDINGVWASMNFPSMITGFCGRVFAQIDDLDLGYATTQAWNDWLYEEWWQPATDRIIPLGLTFLADPEKGAAEIRRNAARGFVVFRVLGSNRSSLRRNRHSYRSACGFLGRLPIARRRSGTSVGRNDVWSTLTSGMCRMVVVRVSAEVPEPEDHDVRGRHRLGGDVA